MDNVENLENAVQSVEELFQNDKEFKKTEYSTLGVPPIRNRIPLVRSSVPPCF
ncbi:MAG: hypothetical protein IJV15_06815 [Lachnospiraceae bacterium]|nr:hypothetical protein [Lachnospiraceae bacterium]